MSTIRVSRTYPVSSRELWEELRHIERHVDWMHDAVRIEFTSPQRSGVGTAFICDTRLGPFATRDRMTITTWTEGEVIGVRHEGLVTGEGRFAIEGDDASSTLTWEERLVFPWWFGGKLGAMVAKPLLGFIWRRNLALLDERVAGR